MSQKHSLSMRDDDAETFYIHKKKEFIIGENSTTIIMKVSDWDCGNFFFFFSCIHWTQDTDKNMFHCFFGPFRVEFYMHLSRHRTFNYNWWHFSRVKSRVSRFLIKFSWESPELPGITHITHGTIWKIHAERCCWTNLNHYHLVSSTKPLLDFWFVAFFFVGWWEKENEKRKQRKREKRKESSETGWSRRRQLEHQR